MARRKFRPKDWARIKYGEFAGNYCRVTLLEKGGGYVVLPYDAEGEPGELMTLDARALDKLPPYVVSDEEFSDLLTAKLMYRDLKESVYPPFNIAAENAAFLTAADIRDALVRINSRENCLDEFKEWFWMILNIFYEQLHIEERYDPEFFTDDPENDDEIFSVAYGMVEKLYWKLEERFGQKEDIEKFVIKFDEPLSWDIRENKKQIEEIGYRAVADDIISRVNVYEFNRGRDSDKRVYSSSAKRHILSGYDSPGSLAGASKEAIDLYREFAQDLYNEGDTAGIKALAWGYFDGNAAFRQDWELAKKYLKELFEKTGDPYAANALGYICYYGFATHGLPEYQEAFRYFSYGAMAGVDESIYRAADMLLSGKGTVKNIDMGLNMIVDGYRETMNEFCAGNYENKLPEYALRMGNACRNDMIYGMNLRDAYKFYLEADYAIKKRKEAGHHPGDSATELKISFEIKRVKERLQLKEARKCVKTDFPLYLNQIFEDRYPVKVVLSVPKNGKNGLLKVSRYRMGSDLAEKGLLPEAPEVARFFEVPKMLVAFPEMSYADLVSEMTYALENITVAQKSEPGPFFLADGFRKNDKTNGLEFFSNGKMVAAIDAQWYVIKAKEGQETV